MVGNNKWGFLRTISKPYCPDILEALQNAPMRFTDLKRMCKSQKTLTQRLHSLEECGAIMQEMQKEKGKRAKLLYSLTQKGKTAIGLVSAFKEENKTLT